MPARAQAAAETGTAASPARPAAVRILIVDDNQDAADTLGMALEMFGCETRIVHSAADALALAPGFTPQVALLDIGLPDMTGYELARRLRRLPGWQRVTLIAATGWGQEKDRQLAFDAGFDHHLTKPIDLERVQQLLAAERA